MTTVASCVDPESVVERRQRPRSISRQVLAGHLGSQCDAVQVGSSQIIYCKAPLPGRPRAGPKGLVHEHAGAMQMQSPTMNSGMEKVKTSPLSAITRRSLAQGQASFSQW
jgi:hypothetical protein